MLKESLEIAIGKLRHNKNIFPSLLTVEPLFTAEKAILQKKNRSHYSIALRTGTLTEQHTVLDSGYILMQLSVLTIEAVEITIRSICDNGH